VIAAIVLTALVFIAVQRLDTARLFAELRSVRVGWIVAALLCYLAILPLWALQWRVLAPQVERNTTRRMFDVVAISSSTHNTTAFMVGEATAIVLLVSQVGLSRSAAVSVIAMDQLLVGIAKLGVLATAASYVTLPGWMANGITGLLVGVVVLLGACLLVAWRHAEMAPWLHANVPPRAAAVIGRVGDTLAPLRSPSRGGGALLLAVAKKAAEVFALLCVQHAFGVQLPFASAILVLAALNLATLVPVIPANLGIFEGAVALTYTYLGVSTEVAVGMAIVSHACYLAALSLPGYGVLARSAVRAAVS
jgi:uncharacterized membrane protein YbhN (UPF0104 family)